MHYFTTTLQYIPRNMHAVFALLCFVVLILWLIFPYPSGLLHWHCGNLTIAPVPAKQPWWIWINTSCELIMNDCITTTKQSTTKPCAYFLGYTVPYRNDKNRTDRKITAIHTGDWATYCTSQKLSISSLQWRHNDQDSVSNHQPHGYLLNRLYRRRSKKTSKLRVTGLCVGNSPGPVNSPHKGPVTRKMFHLMTSSCCCLFCGLAPSHKSHNALHQYPTCIVTEICTHVHISVTKWWIVGYGNGALWGLCNMSIYLHPSLVL